MLKFTVPDMSCDHCVGAVTKALKDVDANAVVAVDLDTKIVTVSSEANAEKIGAALSKAGYESFPTA